MGEARVAEGRRTERQPKRATSSGMVPMERKLSRMPRCGIRSEKARSGPGGHHSRSIGASPGTTGTMSLYYALKALDVWAVKSHWVPVEDVLSSWAEGKGRGGGGGRHDA